MQMLARGPSHYTYNTSYRVSRPCSSSSGAAGCTCHLSSSKYARGKGAKVWGSRFGESKGISRFGEHRPPDLQISGVKGELENLDTHLHRERPQPSAPPDAIDDGVDLGGLSLQGILKLTSI